MLSPDVGKECRALANDRDTSPAVDPIALTARLISLLPRLGLAMSQVGYRQLREVTGLDYSLIDYQGVLAAGGRFALAWWLKPDPCKFKPSLLRAPYHSSNGSIALTAGLRPRGQVRTSASSIGLGVKTRCWRSAKDLYLLHAEWLMAQIRDCAALDEHEKQVLVRPGADQYPAHQSESSR